eukprot:gnl/TRDRNA2_/TRDRNA2_83626_c0_seq1.p1 gnl/TRDRNA2_/TRDRNA2_83626_c0~~gnl/TRDRNA2_/TRDRNA2_83626_c0_seq1.p1  ORF type:complete len:324 (-),score=25.48 gnl/TRDRNA2_/TRDRNA2_83626_c0_seq1:185-1156(-)
MLHTFAIHSLVITFAAGARPQYNVHRIVQSVTLGTEEQEQSAGLALQNSTANVYGIDMFHGGKARTTTNITITQASKLGLMELSLLQPEILFGSIFLQAKTLVGSLFASSVLIFCLSSDDVVWLMPFFTHYSPRWFGLFYIVVMELLVVLSWAMACGIHLLVRVFFAGATYSQESIIRVCCAALLSLYTFQVFAEWYWSDVQDTDQDGDVNSDTSVHVAANEAQTAASVPTKEANKLTYRDLFFITIFGSADNLCVYMSLIASDSLPVVPHVLGTLIAAVAVLALVKGLSRMAWVVKLVEMVPFWCILWVLLVPMWIYAIRSM